MCFSPPPGAKYSAIAASQRGLIAASPIARWAASTSSASKYPTTIPSSARRNSE